MANADYVRWVQRSLNRIMGATLVCDGAEVGPWRPLIANFKTAFQVQEPGLTDEQIGPKCQNQIVRLNDLTPEYCAWINECLGVAGDPTGPGSTEARRKAVMAFQNGRGTVDGWVGAVTERALVDYSFSAPPGDVGKAAPKPAPKPLPDWVKAWRELTLTNRYKQWAIDCADEIRMRNLFNEEIQDLAGVLSRRAANNPTAYLKYFGVQWVHKIARDPPPEVLKPEIITAPDGVRFEVTPTTAKIFDIGLSDTRTLMSIAHRACNTEADYRRNRTDFIAHYKDLWASISAGMGQWNAEWRNPADEYGKARLYIIRGTMEALMRREGSVYWAFRHMKSRKFDGPPGFLAYYPPLWLIDRVVAR